MVLSPAMVRLSDAESSEAEVLHSMVPGCSGKAMCCAVRQWYCIVVPVLSRDGDVLQCQMLQWYSKVERCLVLFCCGNAQLSGAHKRKYNGG